MMRNFLAFILLICTSLLQSQAQDTLPGFSASTRGTGKVIISWTNAYPKVTQLSIQRSFDSTRNFKTILTVPDPSVPQNGFVDAKAPEEYMFYRIFIVLDSGKYLFTKSMRPVLDTSRVVIKPDPPAEDKSKQVIVAENITPPDQKVTPPEPEKFYIIMRRDSIITQVAEKNYKNFRDSIVRKTKDTLVFNNADTILIKPFIPKEVYKPSIYVYTEKDGNVTVSLPDARQKNYSIKFLEFDETPIFEIKRVKEAPMIIDKVNFMHAGWFRFELYENGKLKEKHRFFIPKDF